MNVTYNRGFRELWRDEGRIFCVRNNYKQVEEGGMGEEGELCLGEMSSEVMTNGAEWVGGQTLVYLNVLYEYPQLKHDLKIKY